VNVLSLFDGMSCGQLALQRAGIPYDNYYASEIDKYAISVTQRNFPDTVQLGDVTKVRALNLPKIDMLIGGSPCQGFSFAGKQLNFDDPRSKLFFEFIRLKKECDPRYFLLENVRMKQEYQDIISDLLGVDLIMINSKLVCAQNRNRSYWTNIPDITQPKDKGIILADIIETDGVGVLNNNGNLRIKNDKSNCIDANYFKGPDNHAQRTMILENVRGGRIVGRALVDGHRIDHKQSTAGITTQRLEVRNDQKSNCLTSASKDCVLAGMADINGHDILKRVYDTKGKCPTLTAVCGGNQEKKITEDYLNWRKLTPLECERLQTVPDNYSNSVSNSQRYRMLGNGWTIDVIVHIFSFMKDWPEPASNTRWKQEVLPL